jgi:ubiquinone/menaquinone biosynthesis C-methylase UbiE
VKETKYLFEDILENEKGWLFYDTNLKLFRKIFNSISGKDIIDIGCGGGLMIGLIKLFNPEIKVTGFEGSEEIRPIWKKRNLEVKTGDIYKLPFQDNEFDTVFSSHVIEHLEKPEEMIEESLRVSKKRIIHIVPEGNVNEKNFGTPHLKIYNRVNFIKHFNQKNIRIINYESIQDTHMNSLFICLEKN